MKTIETPIIPVEQTFAKVKGPHELHKEAICVFAATGFFLDQDTYWKDEVVLPPASINTIDDAGYLVKSEPWFQWHYTPKDVSFETSLKEFTDLFESIIEEQVGNQKVILPLSGGLDSRSQAVALKQLNKEVQSYSYSFQGGYPEASISKKIAKVCNFDFKEYQIEQGYLWNCIEELAVINQCYSEFTHPRQMAISNEFEKMGSVFSLGHWGDVLFDKMCDGNLSPEEELDLILKKILKKGGLELGAALWKSWELQGDFESYLQQRVKVLLDGIHIENSSAKIRAFKSLYWAPRWTSINLAVFANKRPITLPYYDDRMCAFICSVPERDLADRQLQIAYIKSRNPKVTKITWQENKPFNLYNYSWNKSPYNLSYRIWGKLRREFREKLGIPYIQRNWELQFLDTENDGYLSKYLFSKELLELVPQKVVEKIRSSFLTGDRIKYSHPLSLLLTLALFSKNQMK